MAEGFYNPAFGFTPPTTVTTTVSALSERDQNLLRGMTPKQVELVASLATQVEAQEVQKRAMLAKGIESVETVGTAAACGFVRGYYPDLKPLGFNPSLLTGLGAHAAAMYVAAEGTEKRDPTMLAYEPHLEHIGNGGLSAFAFEEMVEVGRRLRAQKAAKAAQTGQAAQV